MKSKFIILIVYIIVLNGTLNAEPIEVKMGYFSVIPHSFLTKEQKPQGALIDFFDQEIIDDTEYQARWVGPYTHARLLKMMAKGELDGMSLLVKTKEREKLLYYANHPFYEPFSVMVFLKDHPINEINSADDLKGQRIGFLQGIKGTPFLANNSDKLKMDSITGEDWMRRNLIRLKEKRIEAAFSPEKGLILYEASKLGMMDQIKLLRIPEPPIQLHYVFSKKTSKGKLLLDLYNNRTLDLEMSKKKYIKLMKQYL